MVYLPISIAKGKLQLQYLASTRLWPLLIVFFNIKFCLQDSFILSISSQFISIESASTTH